MSLTLHLDASDTGKLFTTFQGSGVHTGTPSDGSVVEVWDDEGDGIADFCLIYPSVTSQAPTWRASTPLLLQPCLDFDGTDDILECFTQTGGNKTLDNFITAGAYTLLIACYAESITATGTGATGQALISETSGTPVWGFFLRDASGQRKVTLVNWTGSYQTVEADITEATKLILMARHEAGNLYVSVNGGTESSPVASGNTTGMTTPRIRLGRSATTPFFNGRIGEVKLWNTGNADGAGNVATEIAALMAKWVTAAPTTTVMAQDRSIRRRLHPRVFSRVN